MNREPFRTHWPKAKREGRLFTDSSRRITGKSKVQACVYLPIMYETQCDYRGGTDFRGIGHQEGLNAAKRRGSACISQRTQQNTAVICCPGRAKASDEPQDDIVGALRVYSF